MDQNLDESTPRSAPKRANPPRPEGGWPCERPDVDGLWFAYADDDGPRQSRTQARLNKERRAEAAAICRSECPLAQRRACAQDALENGCKHGVWGGVALPGPNLRYRPEQDAAIDELKKIAGREECPKCLTWFDTGTSCPLCAELEAQHAGPQPMSERPKVVDNSNISTNQTAPKSAAETAEAPRPEPAPVPDSPELRRYWALRRRHKSSRDASLRRGERDWLLIKPDGTIEGCYAWSVAERNFERGSERFRRMLAEGWTVRQATRGDRNWNRPTQAPAAQPERIPA